MKMCPIAVWLVSGVLVLMIPQELNAQPTLPGKPSGQVIEIFVDLTDAPRKVQRTRIVIPAAPGPFTFHYPKWIPGEHSPSGPITEMVGLTVRAGDQRLEWRRDDYDHYTFHCQIPSRVTQVEVGFEMVSRLGGFINSSPSSAKLAILNWNQLLVYPKGSTLRGLQCIACVIVPHGWKVGSALAVKSSADDITVFESVSLDTLIDSPVICGEYFRTYRLANAELVGSSHSIDVVSDSSASLDIPDSTRGSFDKLVVEAGTLFGVRHYRSYHFLVSLSDHLPLVGLEHHESSDNRLPERFFQEKSGRLVYGWLLPHEYVHSWCGKYRRPIDLQSYDLQQPLRTRHLWVYEGLTQYLALLLTARSGIWSANEARDWLAVTAEGMRHQTGRRWRSLEDTAISASLLYNADSEWASSRRSIDFYDDGMLIWLEVDTIIREKTANQRSLDDFCKRFFAGNGGEPLVVPYTLPELIDNLNAIAEHDWESFFAVRVQGSSQEAPLLGIRNSGWNLTLTENPTEMQRAIDEFGEQIDLRSSIGMMLKSDGSVVDVVKESAAERAGIVPHMKLVAVNNRRWTPLRLEDAISQTKHGNKLDLLCETGDFFQTHSLRYSHGSKFARLERTRDKPDLLSEILAPKKDLKPSD